MKPKDLVSIIRACKDSGITYLKTNEFEIKFSKGDSEIEIAPVVAHAPIAESPSPVFEQSPDEEEIKHKVEELTSLMKLSDSDLVEQLFPLPKDDALEAV